jgi:hypothetical protein
MKLIGTIHTFNTGRPYASNGQEITWAVIERPDRKRVVVFIDHARMIEQGIDLHIGNLELLTNAWVLNAYDNYHYHYASEEVTFLREQLKGSGR